MGESPSRSTSWLQSRQPRLRRAYAPYTGACNRDVDNSRIMRTALLCLALLIASPLAAESYVTSLPKGRVKADVMQPATSPRAAELSAKLQSAIQGNREAWVADAQKTPADERVAWDDRLGVTREEYAELQRELGDVRLTKASEADLEFVHAADGRVIMRASLPELAGIVFDGNNDVVDTPFGRATERSEVVGSGEQRATGSWSGVQWTLDAPGKTPMTGTTVRIAIGRLIEDGRGILVYEAKSMEPGKVPQRASYVLVFD